MAEKASRYKEMQRYFSYALITDGAIFLLYLVFAGMGVIWLKAVLAILGLLLSGLMLGYLYLTKELLRPRSLWMSAAAAAIAACLLFSLVLNFPSPKYTLPEAQGASQSAID